MELHSKAPDLYVPKFNENRKSPKNEQIEVTLQYLSLEEYEEFSAPGKPFDAVGLLKKGATAIKNLKLNGELIDTGEKLAQVKNGRKKIQPLADELITQLIKESEVSEDEEKNSEGQSNST